MRGIQIYLMPIAIATWIHVRLLLKPREIDMAYGFLLWDVEKKTREIEIKGIKWFTLVYYRRSV